MREAWLGDERKAEAAAEDPWLLRGCRCDAATRDGQHADAMDAIEVNEWNASGGLLDGDDRESSAQIHQHLVAIHVRMTITSAGVLRFRPLVDDSSHPLRLADWLTLLVVDATACKRRILDLLRMRCEISARGMPRVSRAQVSASGPDSHSVLSRPCPDGPLASSTPHLDWRLRRRLHVCLAGRQPQASAHPATSCDQHGTHGRTDHEHSGQTGSCRWQCSRTTSPASMHSPHYSPSGPVEIRGGRQASYSA